VEAAIARDPLFEQVAVFCNHRPFLVALIVLNSRTWEDYARHKGFAQDHPNDPAATANVLVRIVSLLGTLPHFAQVRAVHLTLARWTIEGGLLTPTLKVKRHLLQTTYAREIDALYISGH
jgi:long-chain acyl-CoA synthetase